MEEITLRIGDEVFVMQKDVLCEHSDYFRAMFSGNYVENAKTEICIDMLDPNVMGIILQYMRNGLIDLTEYPLSTLGDISIAVNFLQMPELIKQIEYTLDIQISESTCMEIMDIAEFSSYTKVEQYSLAFALYSFKNMKPNYIKSIHKLAWYLSHPYLDTWSEFDVFNFGLKWIINSKIGADAILIILGCLDLKKITNSDFEEMIKSMREFETSLACKVLDCLYNVYKNYSTIKEDILIEQNSKLCERFTEIVWNETLSIVKENKNRCLKYTPMVPIWILKDGKPDLYPHFLYTYNEEGLNKWLEVAEKNLWGWSVTFWGLTKLIIVCGEFGRGTGYFMKDVKVYDTLRKEWTRHGVELPSRRHAGVAVVGDSLYIAGGVGGFRVVSDSAIIYNLKERSYRKIAKLPDAMQSPALCVHQNKVYAAGQKNIYCHEETNQRDVWKSVVKTEMRMSCMRSFKRYIYCIQSYFSNLYRFIPGEHEKLELVTYFSSLPSTICNLGYAIYAFTWTTSGHSDILTIEEYKGEDNEKPKVILTKSNTSMRINDVAGCCALVLTAPPFCRELSKYHTKHLAKYSNI